MQSRIIHAVDVSSPRLADQHVEELGVVVGCYKFGLEFQTSMLMRLINRDSLYASRMLEELQDLFKRISWRRVMWDGKFHDIPATMGGATKALEEASPLFFTVHASAGETALTEVVKRQGDSRVLAVTVLTSLNHIQCMSIFGDKPGNKVVAFVRKAQRAGISGIVCAPREATELRKHSEFDDLTLVCPGVRPLWAAPDDQDPERVMTPYRAMLGGADYVVVGRPIRKWEDYSSVPGGPKSRRHAAQLINQEIERAIQEKAA